MRIRRASNGNGAILGPGPNMPEPTEPFAIEPASGAGSAVAPSEVPPVSEDAR
jgi:hypothetical protein